MNLIEILDVNLIDLELCAVENKGVNIKYNIQQKYCILDYRMVCV